MRRFRRLAADRDQQPAGERRRHQADRAPASIAGTAIGAGQTPRRQPPDDAEREDDRDGQTQKARVTPDPRHVVTDQPPFPPCPSGPPLSSLAS